MKKHLSKILTLILIICSVAFVFVVAPNTAKNNQTTTLQAASTSLPLKYNSMDEIYTTKVDQDNYGLCWDFAACGYVETMLGKLYNIDIDISEAFLSVSLYVNQKAVASGTNVSSFTYDIGDGANLRPAIYIMQNYGFILEEDFEYNSIEKINSGNAQIIYDYYKDRTIKLSDLGITTKFPCSIATANNWINPRYGRTEIDSDAKIEYIKKHVFTYGAIAASIYSSNAVYKKQTDGAYLHDPTNTSDTNHGVRIVGWDDNYTSDNDKSNKGAFLIENSYGDLYRKVYMRYSDLKKGKQLHVYTHTITADSNISITSNSTAYGKSSISDTNHYLNNKNVFYSNENINLKIKNPKITNTPPVVTFQGLDVSNSFNFSFNNNEFTITTSSTLSAGVYVVKFTTTETDKYFKSFIKIINGVDFFKTSFMRNSGSNFKTNYIELSKSTLFYANDLCLIKAEPTINITNGLKCSINAKNFKFATNSNYASGYISIIVNLDSGTTVLPSQANIKLTFTTVLGTSVNYNLFIVEKTGSYTYGANIYYDLNGHPDYEGSLPNSILFPSNENTAKAYLPQIKSINKTVAGWYLIDPVNKTETNISSQRENGYFYLTFSQCLTSTGRKFESLVGDAIDGSKVKYFILKPIWESIGWQISYDQLPSGITIDDNNHTRVISKTAADKSYTFKIVVKTGFEAKNIAITGVTATTTGNPYEYKINNISSDITIKITADISVIAPTGITLNTTDKTTKSYDGKATTLTATMEYSLNTNFTAHFIWYKKDSQSKTLVDVFDLNKTISTIEVKNVADSGEYTCEVYITLDGADSAHLTTSTPININITKAKIEIDLIDFTIQYGDEFDINKTSDKYKKVSGEIFNNDDLNLTFKTSYNKTSTAGQEYDVEFDKSTNTNYEVVVKNAKAKVTVLKRKLKIKAKSFSKTKNDELYIVTNNDYELVEGNLVNGDTLPLIISCDVKKDSVSGSYDIKIKLDESASNYNKIKDNYDIEFIDGNYSIRASYLEFLITGMRYWCFVQIALTLIVCIAKIVNKKRYN